MKNVEKHAKEMGESVALRLSETHLNRFISFSALAAQSGGALVTESKVCRAVGSKQHAGIWKASLYHSALVLSSCPPNFKCQN